MKWKKLGQIFVPTERAPAGAGFAQSPQALVFDDFVRIYYSTRILDRTGKPLSHVAYVDMDKALRRVVGTSLGTVVNLGERGCFDEHGIFPFNVLRVSDLIYGYSTGWSRRVSVPVDASIGLCLSHDGGRTFQRLGPGPILTSSLHEPFLVGDAFVADFGGFHMWYVYGTRWIEDPATGQPERVYKIGHATSMDGKQWRKEGRPIVGDRLGQDECQALPTVIHFDDRYHMWFCYRHAIDFRTNRNRSYRIGYAFSKDLTDWVRDDAQAGIECSDTGWDCDMLCYPHVFRCDDKIYLLYNGNEFGRHGFGVAEMER